MIVLYAAAIAMFLVGCSSPPVVLMPGDEHKIVNKKKPVRAVVPPEKKNSDIFSLRRNPFLTVDEEKEFGEGKKEIISYLNLSAIIYAPGNSYAVIDGRIVGEKGTIENKKVVKIDPQEVILKDEKGKEYIIRMKNVVNPIKY